MTKYEIKVSCDTEEGEHFVEWRNEQGHSAAGEAAANEARDCRD